MENSNLYINDILVNSGEILASNHISIESKIFIIIVIKQGDMAQLLIYLKEDKDIKFVNDISVFSQDEQAKIAQCFHRTAKTLI